MLLQSNRKTDTGDFWQHLLQAILKMASEMPTKANKPLCFTMSLLAAITILSEWYVTQLTKGHMLLNISNFEICSILCAQLVLCMSCSFIVRNLILYVLWKFLALDKFSYCTFEWYSNVLHQISHNAQSAHACWCNKAVIVWLCVCTGENPLAKARGLSSHTYAQTIQ